jgi:hypothetical protein
MGASNNANVRTDTNIVSNVQITATIMIEAYIDKRSFAYHHLRRPKICSGPNERGLWESEADELHQASAKGYRYQLTCNKSGK